jgi:hypothetical protein
VKKLICSNCGKEISDNSLFCTECGAKITAVKPEAPNQPENLNTEPTQAPVVTDAPPAPAPETYNKPAEILNTPAYVPEPAQQYPQSYQNYQPAPAPIPVYTPPPVQYPQPAAAPMASAPAVSTGIYILMILVNAIPVVGLIAHIIALASTKNKSFKNYCRAVVILGIIGAVLAIGVMVAGYFMFDTIQDFLRQFNIDAELTF